MQKLSGKSLLLVSFYAIFHVFWSREPDLPAASGRTGRYQPLACLCGPCRQRRRPAHRRSHGGGPGGRSGQACRPGTSGIRHGVHHSGVSFHRALPCHPRTASTSFQMLVPLIGGGSGLQLAYSVLFFAAAFLLALRPEKLTNWLGRILCPSLILLIVVLFAGCLAHPLAAYYGAPSAEYAALPTVQGILYGYQTMDTLAGLNFGAVIALNIQARGVTESRAVESGTIRAGLLAGGLLLAVYAMLSHAGAQTGAVYPGLATGAEVLTALAQQLFGRAGLVLIAAIFVIACFNTCVGLIACVGQYFHQLLPRIPYPALAAFFAAASMLVSNLGLAAIIRLSTPVLNAIYPAAIVLILLSFLPGLEQRRAVYPLCVGLTALQSIAAALPLGVLSAVANALPLGSIGFGWVLPALAGLAGGLLLSVFPIEACRPHPEYRPKGAGAIIRCTSPLPLLQLFAFFVVVQGVQRLCAMGTSASILKMVISPMPTSPRSHTTV